MRLMTNGYRSAAGCPTTFFITFVKKRAKMHLKKNKSIVGILLTSHL